jgi:hypothetical protein
MVAEGGQVPSELRTYARQIRERYGSGDTLQSQIAAARVAG